MRWHKRAARKMLFNEIINNPNLSQYEKIACLYNFDKIFKQIINTPIDADGFINLTSKEKGAKKGGEQE